MMPAKVLILSYSHLKSDPRVMRQIRALSGTYAIDTAGISASEHTGVSFYPIYTAPAFSLPRKLRRLFQFLTRRYDAYYWDDVKKKVLEHFKKQQYGVIIANDIHTLPLALAAGNGHSKIYFDAHEYHPREFEDSFKWRLLHKTYLSYLCKAYIPKAHAFSTVSGGIAEAYKSFTGIEPVVITNATVYQDLIPADTAGDAIRLVHHGAALPSRKLELMIDLVKQLDDRFTMDFILVGDQAYISHLKQAAGTSPRIRFLPPMPQDKICRMTNHYDLGIFLLPPTNFNYLHALPNKLFEFVQARLGMAVSPNPEMAALVKTYGLGVVSVDYSSEAMALAINALGKKEIMEFKERAHEAAKALSAEENMKKINAIVAGLIDN